MTLVEDKNDKTFMVLASLKIITYNHQNIL
jgi:hypothetical protein